MARESQDGQSHRRSTGGLATFVEQTASGSQRPASGELRRPALLDLRKPSQTASLYTTVDSEASLPPSPSFSVQGSRTPSFPDAPRQQQDSHGSYDPERDVNVYVIQYNDDKPMPGNGHVSATSPAPRVFKKRLDDEKTKVHHILRTDRGKELLKKPSDAGLLRFVHLPANNMIVSPMPPPFRPRHRY
jgi:hypothetical protein